MTYRTLFCFTFAALAFSACKNDPKTSTATGTPDATPAAAAPNNERPEIVLYSVKVQNLQLRDQPQTKTSKVITKFAEGDFVEGTGERSVNQEEIALRGIPFKDAFYKVTSTTPEQHTGWLFGAGLVAVYAGPRANSPDLGQLTLLNQHLVALNPKDLKSGKKAWDYVQANFANASGSLADAVYILLFNFLFRMETEGEFYTLTEKFNWSTEDHEHIAEDKFDANKYPLTKTLAENGFRVEIGEGMVFPISDWDKFNSFFGNKVTPSMKAFMEQDAKERRDQSSDDGGLIVPIATMAERAAFWEQFNKDNPYFILSERTKINEEWQRSMVFCGMDNTPNRDYESGKINEDFKKVWLEIPQKYPGTLLAAKAKELTDLCQSTQWMYRDTIEGWMTKFQEAHY